MKISSLGRIRLQRGDLLLIQVPITSDERMGNRARDAMFKLNQQRAAKRLPKIPFIVADDRIKFSVISRRDAKRRGIGVSPMNRPNHAQDAHATTTTK